ncbi:hypothetical protein CISG_08687 [Coccidioides immitis RMSCC 3703]|uniref:Uncharacterized protein n=2 Tax=Coccidioides immitis TaxID=5501 RepID=A0A0J8R6U3_COCIT|nr:hypothetical protein CIRG_00759 [Coccidioides immitis RMSCC 2394]KMU80744.1 hypothetical protein CISG_08687 [Coccidioides immitis RMSCC 3703]
MAEERFTLAASRFPLGVGCLGHAQASTSVERTTTRLPAAIVAASRSLAAQLHRLTTVPRAFKPSKTGVQLHQERQAPMNAGAAGRQKPPSIRKRFEGQLIRIRVPVRSYREFLKGSGCISSLHHLSSSCIADPY